MRNDKKSNKLIILTAGGTGGHVYPAEALAEELLKRGYELALVTDKRGKDNYKGKLGEIDNYAVYAGGIVGKSYWFKVKSLFKIGWGTMQALWILLKKRPLCVVGFGGYASFPCSVAAILTGTDLVIHEQNSVMSRTNRFLSNYADLICQSFKNAKYASQHVKSVLTGMPIRKAVAELSDNKYPLLQAKDKVKILILGGSQGASVFSKVVPEAVKLLSKDVQKRLEIVQQCRKSDVDEVRGLYQNLLCRAEVESFFNNMPELYANAHLIISRSGASSVSEIAVAGVPSVLVPLPTAADDHQTKNAEWLTNAKAGLLIKQKELTPELLAEKINDVIVNNAKYEKMSQNARRIGIKNAAERFANAIEKEILKKK